MKITEEEFIFLIEYAKIGTVECLSTTTKDYEKMDSIKKKYKDIIKNSKAKWIL